MEPRVLTRLSRVELVRRFPSGGVVAEIGVAKGTFSRVILNECRPERLYLVDSWRPVLDAPNSHLDPHNVGRDAAEQRYQSVVGRFEGDRRVVIRRGLSREIIPALDGPLSWAYIDADHRYDHVRSDLTLVRSKLSPSGFIAGHDYTNSEFAQKLGFGVVDAVDEFLSETGWVFVALTLEEFPTYVLAPPGHLAMTLEQRIRFRLVSLPGARMRR